jgi:DNA-binding LytR/AlgR family response regulator
MNEFFFVKNGEDYIQIFFTAILYIQAGDKYSSLVTTTKKLLIPQSLNNLERALPSTLFCRIHRSYIVSLAHTKSFNHTTATIAGKKIPIGKQYRSVLPARAMAFNNEQQPLINLSDFDILLFFKNLKQN